MMDLATIYPGQITPYRYMWCTKSFTEFLISRGYGPFVISSGGSYKNPMENLPSWSVNFLHRPPSVKLAIENICRISVEPEPELYDAGGEISSSTFVKGPGNDELTVRGAPIDIIVWLSPKCLERWSNPNKTKALT
jgi:hypothetical protein